MRVPLSWLREYVDFQLAPGRLAERLTLLGMEVRSIERIGDEWHGVVTGELLQVAPHPNTPRLSLTQVRTAPDGPVLGIVCGATNIEPGQRVPVALPGAILPGGRRIDVAPKAGVQSHGMLCSGDELGLTSDADGILILPRDTPIGRPLAELYGDVVLDVDVKPNRGDALSLIGLAREVAALTGGTVRWPDTAPPERGDATADHVSAEVRDGERCPRFVARYVDGVTVGPSPLAVQLRLGAAGMRPVSNVVDATNYVMLEMGKPTHVFDAAAVSGGRLVVRAAYPGERLETLDHVQRELGPDTLVIADPECALAIAGVMGGARSEVADSTTAVIIESAVFDPVSVRRTGQRFGLRSEASLRFEKGQESRLARLGADRVARLLAEWAGARPAVGAVDTDPVEPPPARIRFRPDRVDRILGTQLAVGEMRDLLGRVGFATEADGAAHELVAIVPSHRRDIVIESDIIEEIARVRGYETIPSTLPETPMPPYRADPRRFPDGIRDLLSGQGLNEVLSHVLIGPRDHALLGIPPDSERVITVANPISVDHSQMRVSLLPSLMRVLTDNERQRRQAVAIFELGPEHEWAPEGVPLQRSMLGLVLAGSWAPISWAAPARDTDAADARGIVEWLVDRVAGSTVRWGPAVPMDGVEHPGRTAVAMADAPDGLRVEIGRAGELDPRYLRALEARQEPVAFALVSLDVLRRLVPERVRVRAIPRVPAIERDLAVVLAESRPAGEVDAVIRAAGGSLVREVTLFDRYQGVPLAEDEASLAFRLRLQADERTLTDAEVDAVMGSVVTALADRLGARIRR